MANKCSSWHKTPKASKSPTLRDLAWSAGFIDGEGHINWTDANTSPRITAAQNSPELLKRLQDNFGGSITSPKAHKWSVWTAYGSRALGIMQTLYPFFSAKRKDEVRKVLMKARGN